MKLNLEIVEKAEIKELMRGHCAGGPRGGPRGGPAACSPPLGMTVTTCPSLTVAPPTGGHS